MDLTKVIKDMKKAGFGGALVGQDIPQGDIIPFRNKAMNLITEGGLPFGHIHEFFGLSQTGKCVGGETLIATKEGLIPIEDLFIPYVDSNSETRTLPIHTLLEPERWYRMKKPISVLNPNGEYEETSRLYYGGKESISILYTENGFHLSGTDEHKILIKDITTGEEKHVSLEAIRKNKSKYVVPVKLGTQVYGDNTNLIPSTDMRLPTTLTEELAYDLGILSTSLYISNYFGPKIVKNKKPEFLRLRDRWEDKGYKIESYNKAFIKWVQLNEIIVSTADTIEVPFVIKQAPRNMVLAYLTGVMTNMVSVKGVLRFRHKSYHMLTQLHTFLTNEGIMSTMHYDTRHEMKMLSIEPDNLGCLKEYIIRYADEGCDLYKAAKNCRPKTESPRIIYETIRRVWKSKTELPVYDLEMPDTHVYIANGFYSHNSYFMYETLAQAQKKFSPTVGIIIDREGAYTQERGEQLGIDNKLTIVTKPYDTPMPMNAVAFIEKSVKGIYEENPNAHIVILLDSLAAFDKDVALDKEDMGKGAKAWHSSFRSMLNYINNNTVLLFSNHVTYKPVAFGNNKTKVGGEAGNYYRSCGIALDRRSHIQDERRGGEVVGDRLGVVVDKTRRGPSLRKLILPYYYTSGVTEYAGYLWLLAARGYITPKNQDDFKKGVAKTYIYEKDGQSFQLLEGQEELILKKYKELDFDQFPPYREVK